MSASPNPTPEDPVAAPAPFTNLESIADQLARTPAPEAVATSPATSSPQDPLPMLPGLDGAADEHVPSSHLLTDKDKALGTLPVPIALGLVGGFAIFLADALLSHNHEASWLGLLTMNVLGTVGFNLMLRRSQWKAVDQWVTAAVLQTGLFVPFLVKEIISPIHFPHYTPFEIMLLAIAVTGLMCLQICNVKALKHLEASVYSVVFNVRILFATILGWVFLQEVVGLWALLGGLLIFAAIFIVRQKGVRSLNIIGILLALGAAVAMSGMNTSEKALIQLVGYQQYIFPMFAAACIIMWGIVLVRRTEVPFGLLFRPQGLGLMALRAAAGIGFSSALVFGPVAVSSYLSSLSVVLLVVFGMLFLGERDYMRQKVIATIVAIAGLTFILVDSL